MNTLRNILHKNALFIFIVIFTIVSISNQTSLAMTVQPEESLLSENNTECISQNQPNLTEEDLKKLLKIAQQSNQDNKDTKIILSVIAEQAAKKDADKAKPSFFKTVLNDGTKCTFGWIKDFAKTSLTTIICITEIAGIAYAICWYKGWIPNQTLYYPYKPTPTDIKIFLTKSEYPLRSTDTSNSTALNEPEASNIPLKDYCYDGSCYPELCKNAWPWPLGPSDCPQN